MDTKNSAKGKSTTAKEKQGNVIDRHKKHQLFEEANRLSERQGDTGREAFCRL